MIRKILLIILFNQVLGNVIQPSSKRELFQPTQLGVCGGGCTSSAACANEAGDLLCRCVNFVCSMTEQCGGGCLTDSQCDDWSGGDDKCVCYWGGCALESRVKEMAKNPKHILSSYFL